MLGHVSFGVRDLGRATRFRQLATVRAANGLSDEPYDVVIEADSSGQFIQLDPPDPASWAAARATWWVESWWTLEAGPEGMAELRRRIEAGPPR